MKKFNLILCAKLLAVCVFAQTTAGFENLSLPIDSFWNGSDNSGGFSSGNVYFRNEFNQLWGSWSGFGYSTMRDSTTAGYLNQYSAITATGYNSSTYAVASAYGGVRAILTGSAAGGLVSGFYVTNSTYAYLSMRDGDMFAKKFGGTSGNDPDWFKLSVLGYKNGAVKANVVDVYLADFRFNDNSQDYILKNWQWVNLISLGDVDSLEFVLTSSDTGSFGMNTPAYFCLDNLITLNQPNSAPVAANDFVTINFNTDTMVNVLANDADATATPLTVSIIGGPLVQGATAMVMSNQIHYTPQTGVLAMDTITYRVCDQLGACDTALLVVNITGVNNINQTTGNVLKVYPNPFAEEFYIEADKWSTVTITNTYGSVVLEINCENSPIKINTTNWSAGIYYVQTAGTTRKMIKQ